MFFNSLKNGKKSTNLIVLVLYKQKDYGKRTRKGIGRSSKRNAAS